MTAQGCKLTNSLQQWSTLDVCYRVMVTNPINSLCGLKLTPLLWSALTCLLTAITARTKVSQVQTKWHCFNSTCRTVLLTYFITVIHIGTRIVWFDAYENFFAMLFENAEGRDDIWYGNEAH